MRILSVQHWGDPEKGYVVGNAASETVEAETVGITSGSGVFPQASRASRRTGYRFLTVVDLLWIDPLPKPPHAFFHRRLYLGNHRAKLGKLRLNIGLLQMVTDVHT